jgi:hypothetical protein
MVPCLFLVFCLRCFVFASPLGLLCCCVCVFACVLSRAGGPSVGVLSYSVLYVPFTFMHAKAQDVCTLCVAVFMRLCLVSVLSCVRALCQMPVCA